MKKLRRIKESYQKITALCPLCYQRMKSDEKYRWYCNNEDCELEFLETEEIIPIFEEVKK